MAKCKKCGTYNQPEIQYCLHCGEKLDIEIETTPQKKRTFLGVVYLGVSLLLLFIILYIAVWILYALILPPKLPEIKEEKLNTAKTKLDNIRFNKVLFAKFTTQELTALYNKYFLTKNSNLHPLFISIDKNNDFCFSTLIKYQNSSKLPVSATISGTPVFDIIDDVRVITGFKIKSITIMKISIPSASYSHFLPYFEKYLNLKAKSFLHKVFDIKISNDKAVTLLIYDINKSPDISEL